MNSEVIAGSLLHEQAFFVIPKKCLETVLSTAPPEISQMMRREIRILGNSSASIECNHLITGTLYRGKSPTDLLADFMEVYRGFVFPAITKPYAQCVFTDSTLVGCRYEISKKCLQSDCRLHECLDSIEAEELITLHSRLINSADSRYNSRECKLMFFLLDCERKLLVWCGTND